MHPLIAELREVIRLNESLPLPIVRSLLKVYLQNYVLDFLYEHKKYKNLIFYGGTCLRKIYDLDRMSEDLDFETTEVIDYTKLADDIQDYFRKTLHYKDLIVKAQRSNHIQRIILKFPILSELGLRGYENEALHIKLEINNCENTDYPTEVSPISVSKFTIFVKHYDLPTLMAGKIVACLNRSFMKGRTGVTIKGRDYYDLIWYMSRDTKPNEDRLKSYSKDTTAAEAFDLLDKHISNIKPKDLLIDLSPFFVKQQYIKTWCENFHLLYDKYRPRYK